MTPALRSLTFIALSFALLTSCNKSPKPCDTVTGIIGNKGHLADLSPVSSQPEFNDLLAQHPELQAYRAFYEDSMYGMHCHVFYKDIIVLTSNYALFKGVHANNPVVITSGEIPSDINISLTPAITADSAVVIARKQQDYSYSCVKYQLGIWDMNAVTSGKPKDYRLIWNITGNGEYPIVHLDAQTGEVYYSFDGRLE
jgi:hypothetical protein